FAMRSNQLQKHHIQSFAKLSIYERLSWAFSQYKFLYRFMNTQSKKINKDIRRNGKRYFQQ
ncbi:MAG: hypothetical protein B1H08_05275, partial [Candidatus Omnitrophica bacterium 4484_171]